jgi:hypothetical protein
MLQVLIGRNNKQNDELSIRVANGVYASICINVPRPTHACVCCDLL